jgi:hypothetical protein
MGFLSPAKPNEGCIHFTEVHPGYRIIGIGKHSYHRFFNQCKEDGRDTVRAGTSPVGGDNMLVAFDHHREK